MVNNILIVDDTSMNRKILVGIISISIKNVMLFEAEDGFKALEIVKQNKINLIILDIMMPNKDGMELLEELKSNSEYSCIPVIMCTAVYEKESIEKALSLGALDYFRKPLSEEVMNITLPLKIKNALMYYEQNLELTRLYNNVKDEMLMARKLQKSLIKDHERLKDIEMYGTYHPCEEIGGDFYCSKQVGEKNWFIIADVLGHSITAAMISAMLKVVFNNSILTKEKPEEVLAEINKIMLETFSDSYNGTISAFVGCVEGNMLQVANAGHPYPVLFKANTGQVEEIELNGFLLGIFETVSFDHASYELNQGDCMVLYTDGIFDKGKENGFVNWDKVKNYCSKNIFGFLNDSQEYVNNMLEYFAEIDGNNFIDDAAIMLIKKL